MAVGNFPFPDIDPVLGVNLGIVQAGIRYKGRDDLLVIELEQNSSVAGVFTQNAFAAAPVIVARKHLEDSKGSIRYLVINAGNANACTGEEGIGNAMAVCKKIAEIKDVKPEQVLPFSTGVVGEQLPLDNFIQAIPKVLKNIEGNNWLRAARAIMTTDTRPKGAAIAFEHDGYAVRVAGIAKGVGMIKPNMATMLAFIVTDADVDQKILKKLVKEASDASLNRIVVDGDTSTNDAAILMATGQCGLDKISDTDNEYYNKLKEAVFSVFFELSRNLVCDGEGSTKFVRVNVTGGLDLDECRRVAYSIAQSPLVKTALFASDPNWGRIVVAIGYAGIEDLDPNLVSVKLGDVLIVENGQRAEDYQEEMGQEVMNQEEIFIDVDLGRGEVSHQVWTTDFSHEYVTINAEYRT